jgi:hypothetical protein
MSDKIYPIGTIFKPYLNKPSYWKIIGAPKNSFFWMSYPVIKCNKNGKEFSDQNGFTVDFVNNLPKDQIFIQSKINDKVSTSGKQIGILKRRLGFLIKRVDADLKEIQKIKTEIGI